MKMWLKSPQNWRWWKKENAPFKDKSELVEKDIWNQNDLNAFKKSQQYNQ
jgi:hypothetical protein